MISVAICDDDIATKKCFFAVVFDAIWMLIETLINDLLMIYCVNLANSHIFGSLCKQPLSAASRAAFPGQSRPY